MGVSILGCLLVLGSIITAEAGAGPRVCGCEPDIPVCGSDGNSYESKCEMNCGRYNNPLQVLYYGSCRDPQPKPIPVPFNPHPLYPPFPYTPNNNVIFPYPYFPYDRRTTPLKPVPFQYYINPSPAPVVYPVNPAPVPVVYPVNPAPGPVIYPEPAPVPVPYPEPAPVPVPFPEPAPIPVSFNGNLSPIPVYYGRPTTD